MVLGRVSRGQVMHFITLLFYQSHGDFNERNRSYIHSQLAVQSNSVDAAGTARRRILEEDEIESIEGKPTVGTSSNSSSGRQVSTSALDDALEAKPGPSGLTTSASSQSLTGGVKRRIVSDDDDDVDDDIKPPSIVTSNGLSKGKALKKKESNSIAPVVAVKSEPLPAESSEDEIPIR